jgi:hypothetical protein
LTLVEGKVDQALLPDELLDLLQLKKLGQILASSSSSK